MKTRMITTHKNGRGKKKGNKGWHKHQTRKVSKTHRGYGMKRIVKSHMTSKRSRGKR